MARRTRGQKKREAENNQGGSPQGNPNSRKDQEIILNLAVVIMGSLSCYTTALGLAPMLGNKFLAFFTAVALSMFMIVIAISIPSREQKLGSIFAYSLVASFSVLLNFNAIYGVANSKTLLYEELVDKRQDLISLQRVAIRDLDSTYKVAYWNGELEAANKRMEAEKQTPGEEGCGPRCRKIYREEVMPALGELEKAEKKAKQYKDKVYAKVKTIYPEPLGTIIEKADPKQLRVGVQDVVEVYQDIARDIGPVTEKDYGTLLFENKNVGNLSHAVNTITSVFSKDKKGEAKAAIFISFLISFIIDFIVLFVVLFLAPKVEKKPKSRISDEEKVKEPKRRGKAGIKPNWSRPKGSNNNNGEARQGTNQSGPFMDRS